MNYCYRWHNCLSQKLYIFNISMLSKLKSSSTWVILLPSAYGLSFTFMLSLYLLSFCTNYESIVIILSVMCIVPKFIIDWFIIVLLVVLKLLVSSHPLNFEGVLAFMFCCFIKDKLSTTLLCFLFDNNCFQCIIIHCLLFELLLML